MPDINSRRSVQFTFSTLRCLFHAQIPLFPNHPASYPRRSQFYGCPGIRSRPGSKGLCLSFVSPFLPLNNIKDTAFSYNVLFREFSVFISFSNVGFGFLVSQTRFYHEKMVGSPPFMISSTVPLTIVLIIYRELCLYHRRLMLSLRKLKTVTKAQNM